MSFTKYLTNILNKDEDKELVTFQESDPERQKAFEKMSDEQKANYLARRNRTLKYVLKRQNFVTMIIKELDEAQTDEERTHAFNQISMVYGKTQVVDIFSTEFYYKWKMKTNITPLFEMLDTCVKADIKKLKEQMIEWLFLRTKKENVRWDVIVGLIHCDYINYTNLDKLVELIDKYIEPVNDGKLSAEILERLTKLIIPQGYSMAGQSFISRWFGVARDLNDYESVQKMIDVGFKVEYKTFGKDEVVINSMSGFLQFSITNLLRDLDLFFENSKNMQNEDMIKLKALRAGYKNSLVHKVLLNFNEVDIELFNVNKIKPDMNDLTFFVFLISQDFKIKELNKILTNHHLNFGGDIFKLLKKNLPVLFDYAMEE